MNPVKLHAYDVSNGKARQISVAFLGKYVDGLYHTGVKVYGNEYFYGGQGIAYCPPCGTNLGHPTEIIDMGSTAVDQEKFHEFLEDLAATTFKPQDYRIHEHNCNTFSMKVVQFLTGKTLPNKIANVNSDIANSPLGKLIIPMIKNMQGPQHNGVFIQPRKSKPHGNWDKLDDNGGLSEAANITE